MKKICSFFILILFFACNSPHEEVTVKNSNPNVIEGEHFQIKKINTVDGTVFQFSGNDAYAILIDVMAEFPAAIKIQSTQDTVLMITSKGGIIFDYLKTNYK